MWAKAGYTGMGGTTAYGLIDKTGALVKDPTAKSTQWATLVDLWGGINHAGGGMVAAQDSVSGLWGYLDAKSGEWKIQPLFSEAKPFADGMAYAKDFATDDWASSTIPAHGRLFLVWITSIPTINPLLPQVALCMVPPRRWAVPRLLLQKAG